MPFYMSNALTVSQTRRYPRRPRRLQPLNHQDISKDQETYKNVPLRPMESRIFSKLFDNSHRLTHRQRSTECRQRLPSTPVDAGIVRAPTCCRHHWDLYEESRRHLVDAVLPYHDAFSPPRPAAEALRRRGSPDRLVQLVERDLERNFRMQLPLSTIIVRWHKFRNKEGYSIVSIYDKMRQFGKIDNVTMTSPVSARVTFQDLDSACRAVDERFVGPEEHPLLCLWYHHGIMGSKGFYIRRRHLHVVTDPYTSEDICTK